MFVNALHKTRWEELYCKDSCHEKLEYFHMVIDNLLDTYMPKQLVTINRNEMHWTTPDFKQIIIKRQ